LRLITDTLAKKVEELEAEITERKRVEAALRKSEERFRALIENAPDGIALLGADGRLRQVTPSSQRILGYIPEDEIGQDPIEKTHPDDLPELLGVLNDLIQNATGVFTKEYRFRHKDGSWRWLESTISNLLNEPSVEALVFNYRDITERKRMAEELQQYLNELGALYRASAPLIAVSRDLTQLGEEIVQAVTNEFALADCGILLVDEAGNELKRLARAGNYQVKTTSNLPLDGQGLTIAAFKSGEVIYAPDVSVDPRYIPNVSQTRSELVIPLRVGEQVIGVLDLQSSEPAAFEERARRIIAAYAERAALALQNAQLYVQTEQRLQQLTALRTIDQAITASLDLSLTLEIFLDQMMTQQQVDAADVLLLDPGTLTLEYAAGRGFRSRAVKHSQIHLGQGYAGRVVLEQRILGFRNLVEEEPDSDRAVLLEEENFQAYYGLPLIAKGQVEGVLEVFHRTPLTPTSDWLDFLETLAGQAAIAINNSHLFNDLQRSNISLVLAYDATIEGWSHALDLRDRETEGHSQRVTDLTVQIAQAMGLNEVELVHVRRGALLHDIGKMGIPDAILLKPGPLTDEEWVIMRKHPTYAYELLSPIAYLRPALDIPYCHHEKWDGTGYPHGLKREQIPLAARLFAVTDVWDALTSDRPYRAAWTKEKALEYIHSQSGIHFDPKVIEVFSSLVSL
jgi:PAS domain S-box-containing protein